MATIKQVKEQIKNANALGIANLARKGVEVCADATTYEIMNSISQISDGNWYTDIVYNDDNTITLIDKNGVAHTMSCAYDDNNKLICVTCDNKVVELSYDGDVLEKVGKTNVRMLNVPCDNRAEEINLLIDESGLLEANEYTITEKVQQLIDMVKRYKQIIENGLATTDGQILTDKDGLYILTNGGG